MLSRTLLLSIFASIVASQSTTPAVVCVPGQCIQGYSNVSIGASLSKGSEPTLHLLPGEYKSNTDPKLLHDMLTSSSSSLSSSPGFTTSAKLSPLPLNLKLEPGLAIYSGANYSGQGGFTALPTQPIPQNTSTPIPANSLAISENVWVAVSSGSNNNSRVVLWESVPDVAQLGLSSLNLLDLQSTACTPACSSSGICSASGSCVCPPNFSGPSCESCAAGHFGADCKPCPEGCTECDEGMSGSGQCFSINVGPTDPKTCNCVNGECTSGGTCECNQGWIDGPESKCSACQTGFFLSSTGSCTACQVGCERCDSTTAACASCKAGFQQDDTDRTRCIPIRAVIPGGQNCPVNTFGNQATGRCEPCARECDACSGAGSGSCLTCARGLYMANGQCVSADTNGVCAGTDGLVADNIKRVCDACPSKCASCSIPNFDEASNIGELQCTTCTPGSFLSQGRCVDSCPAGTFVNPQDNRSCIPCSSSCATCAGSADFCTACTGTLFASSGQCVQSCPANTFSITSTTTPPRNSCTPCHPDCSTCSGASFNQCLTCSASRPVLSTTSGSSSGRCLPTCNKNQFFDAAGGGGCKSCDGSCGSCVGAGTNQCLSCQSPNQVVRDGQCVEANCSNGSSVVPGLGICLSSLVFVPSKSENGDPLPPLPTITGISEPAPKEGKMKLEWWQILLMALGCAFIFVMFLWCWRRRAKKQRKARTEQFANGKGLNDKRRFWDAWGAGLRRMFGRKNKHAKKQSGELPIAYNHQDVALREMREEWRESKNAEGGMNKMSNLKKPSKKSLRDDGREDGDLDSYINAYDYSRRSVAMTVKSHTPSTLPDLDGYRRGNYIAERERLRRQAANAPVYRDLDTDSMYSEFTGQQRNTPEPRQALKSDLVMPSFASSRRSPSPPPVWNNNSNKLKKPMVVRKQTSSGDTLSSVVIAPQPIRQDSSEAILVDLLDSPDSERHYPFKIASPRRVSPPPLLPPVQPLATFASLDQPPRTEAEAYAMANKPALMLSQQQAQPQYTLAWIPTQMTGSSFGNSGPLPVITPNMTGSTTLGGASGGGGTSYWLNQPPVPVKSDSPTGDSKNPFRQGPVAF